MPIQSEHQQSLSSASPGTTPSSHVNYRYLSATQPAIHLKHSQQQRWLASKHIARLQDKISRATVENSIVVDNEMHHGLRKIIGIIQEVQAKLFSPSFLEDATTRQDARGMHWHPAIIRWCLHLRHRSSGAYEELCGVLKLPSQLTLRDYVHYIKTATGFSTEVDQMPVHAAKVAPCPEREKNTFLLIDEMYIHEDLVYDKHRGISYILST